ncbi:MAG: hypothetical protein UX85_C0003G0158 [Candidatus Beckwithbacteria bacterium GW2011_GWB1_47_15]|uniref:Uncharacterized protein n=1 Tax=Candidatus Beckwithbacteria bacterium GW2011_GWB1_47_15 TaxID=1618371 RepID=A0A0G1RVY8_9BACT|nr:MAG: hypothetical protein UX50_C0005G0046 [Candidatus Beckwithbacteria bacterium GW2011_GWA1_46_30]KKU61499.1 MAG: hypothetical protein UX85_C0003G0158 [Candidatus Beckwithbacteria bacterium GW2011_GWB1_47_15]KKU71703.1 MAG: hypothetical protein UX97_C0004G0026 [Candidatus Beckwithbacteria bacterium GW2011_GWA2_47_25]KKW03801.1 MAG: hypothetical protein UY37_C0004G0094 [Candidatus Beckwithbacteria bacterium GW2011_GWC2_49_11]OGD48101.1 MAG: hypothetical protein A2877_00155 [Candidatus Beckwi
MRQGKIVSQLSQIILSIEAVSSQSLSWSLDTCHAWAAGYSLGNLGKSLIGNDIVKGLKMAKILE